MKLLVTGGLGFIGSNFIQKLLNENNDLKILNVDAELDGSNTHNLENLKNSTNYEFIKGNISNKKFMEEQISKCDAVVNFAAESHVDRSINDANPFLVSNIRGAFTILDIITRQQKRMIQVSTDEVFGSLLSDPYLQFTEETPYDPRSPYSASKAGVIGFTKSLGKELAEENITVNCIAPAVINTPMIKDVTKQQLEYMIEKIPMKKMGEISDIVNLVNYLTNSKTKFSTGAVFDLSGGRATY